MKNLIKLAIFLLVVSLVAVSCKKDSDDGTLTLSITDAPVDNADIAAVWLTITDIQYHKNDKDWTSFEGFTGPQTFNILELTEGVSALMGSFELETGHYTQLRFFVDAPEENTPNPTSPGCYIEFLDGSESPLFVPSGSESGWKGVGGFEVPINGDVEVTADFDARKSIFITGADKYILKPTIRLIVDNQAGQIVGGVTNVPAGTDLIIFAYEDGTYAETEAADPVDELTARFPNAITSDDIVVDLGYKLAFLAAGVYDLVIASYDEVTGEFLEVLGIVEDVTVISDKTTNVPIDISSF